MKRITLLVSWLLLGLVLRPSIAQNIPLGTWRTHLSYQSITTLAIAGERIYGGTAGSLFYVDRFFNNYTKLSKIDGLSELDVSALNYDLTSQRLVIAYQSGNIDLLISSGKTGESDRVIPIRLIGNAGISGSKAIRDVAFRNNLAYLSADFGLVVLDLLKAEVRETGQNIGKQGASVAVYASTFARDSIFLASSQGVMATSLASSVNLQDYRNWITFSPAKGIPASKVDGIVSRNGRVYAGVSGTGLFVYENGKWTNVYPIAENIQRLRLSGDRILISTSSRLLSVHENNEITPINDLLLKAPREAAFDSQGKLWVADAQSGLLTNRQGRFEALIPNGPASNHAWKLYYYRGKIAALSGGMDENSQPYNREQGFYIYNGASWTNFNSQVNPAIPPLKDLVALTYNPLNQHVYLGSFDKGLWVQKPDLSIENVTGAPLVASLNGGVRVTGLATDTQGNVWVSNHSVLTGRPSLHVWRAGKQWESFTFQQPGARDPLDLLIDGNGYKWLRLDPQSDGGLLVFDDQTRQTRYLTTATGNGGLPNQKVRCMQLDKEGQVWVGTDQGVAYFINTVSVFSGNYGAFTPIFNARRLLSNESITSLEVDGGNRKWIGTRNGLWLFSADGTEQLAHFTTKNSPLLSDYITDVRVEPVTGEVFIATNKGILSYRGTATEAGPEHAVVKVFPNPVRPDFQGLVGISGLAAQATVKITDVAGRLVYETRANGGTATWNVRDYNGNRAETGIYLVFSASEDGVETFVTKLAIVK
jgi:ligand-binding sensor domain-containing protein